MRRDASMQRLKIHRYPYPPLSREFSAQLQKSTIPVAVSTKEVAKMEAGRETTKEAKERAKEVAHTVGGSSLVKGRTEKAMFTLIRCRVDKVKVSDQARDLRLLAGPLSNRPNFGVCGLVPFNNSSFGPTQHFGSKSVVLYQMCNRPGHTAPFCQFFGAQAHLTHGTCPGLHDLDWTTILARSSCVDRLRTASIVSTQETSIPIVLRLIFPLLVPVSCGINASSHQPYPNLLHPITLLIQLCAPEFRLVGARMRTPKCNVAWECPPSRGRATDAREKESPLPVYDPKVEGW
ncbi:hypothetical protein CRG98_023607 [Punica granatum]|uniref:Uncharacterized protein n=1 Tax=Punica granatum TaxID=22663 RepID=A0A2I0JJD1_PUNGR|nr:hypothetical protein CRG98_023607 [Punica granatum]